MEGKTKRIIMLGIVLMTMIVSLEGCFWGFEDRDRGGGHERSEGHDHDRGGGHEERR